MKKVTVYFLLFGTEQLASVQTSWVPERGTKVSFRVDGKLRDFLVDRVAHAAFDYAPGSTEQVLKSIDVVVSPARPFDEMGNL